ncbi:MAG: GGDEF domain-containing protein [Lachnospiraceae bacterium]|nr:GGDEF domain-containing protein [Lachnospiraceae bacterium]
MKQTSLEKYTKKMIENYIKDVTCTYTVNVTEDRVEADIITKSGRNITQIVGMTTPCSYNELVKRVFYGEYTRWECSLDTSISELSCEALQKAYEAGQRYIEATLYFAEEQVYYRMIHMLDRNEYGNGIIAHVICRHINSMEKVTRQEIADMENIISSAGIGIWHIYLFDNEKPRMRVNAKMKELLGIYSDNLSEEEVYEIWYSRIKKSALPTVTASVTEMIAKGKSENTYVWQHPTLGDIYVRCGGISSHIEGKGYVLRGYHSDVTEIINSETKQKQLLADALEEVKHQKELLQQALDNYKQADYDRRTDYLTGLRNRQDMYEMLQDSLSGMRDSITAMYMMDVDNFKLLNDNYGHLRGDECLKRIGQALTEYGKQNDVYFYRYGGEEILGIRFGNAKPALEIADELVRLVYDLKIERDDVEAGAVTVSLGYTCDYSCHEKMIDKADAAMYRAKANGKNQAVCYENM